MLQHVTGILKPLRIIQEKNTLIQINWIVWTFSFIAKKSIPVLFHQTLCIERMMM